MKKSLALLCLIALGAMVSGCNTVEGAGKDIQAGGQAVEKAADKAKKY